MASGEQELQGPDLARGIDAGTLKDGESLLGHARGEAVLLVRSGGRVHAVGATCTHYGGPLAEGLVVGDTVRCPWHHACFSLRTGEALGAPALNPVACFEVEEKNGRIGVGAKRDGVPQRTPAKSPESVVIVGAGAAGNAAAEALRNEGYDGPVTMIGEDPSVPYDRPNLSKDYLAGNAPEEWIPLRPESFYEERKIRLQLGRRVEKLDLAGSAVVLDDGSTIGFGALLLATGADPIRLPIPGADRPHVHLVRTLADSRAIIARLAAAKRAVVIGAGFIGLEAAASLRKRGVEVTVVAPGTVPLGNVLGDALGAAIRRIHEAQGVTFLMGHKPASIESDTVTLDDGTKLPCDLVVMGVGVRPSTRLAEEAGLALDRGVVVDAQLRTSAPSIWAAGDIARWPDARTGGAIRVEHWVVAERQGQAAARNILGANRPFDAVPFFWSAHFDVTISYVGHAESWDRVDVAGSVEAHDCAVAYRRGGVTLAVATIGRDRASLEAEAAMERGDEAALRRIVPAS